MSEAAAPRTYRPGEVAARLNLAPSTLRTYAAQFAELLSADARAEPGGKADGFRHRRYTAADLATLERIQGLLAAGLSYRGVASQLTGAAGTEPRRPRRSSVPRAERRPPTAGPPVVLAAAPMEPPAPPAIDVPALAAALAAALAPGAPAADPLVPLTDQLAGHEHQLRGLASRLAVTADQIQRLRGEVGALAAQVARIEGDVQDLTARIGELVARLEPPLPPPPWPLRLLGWLRARLSLGTAAAAPEPTDRYKC